MENGRFTAGERERLLSLDAVDEARAKPIVHGKPFKEERIRRRRADGRPGAVFADIGLPSPLIGRKRVGRAICHWEEAEAKGVLTAAGAPQARHRDRIDAIKRGERETVGRQRGIRRREVTAMEEELAKRGLAPGRARRRPSPRGRRG